MKKIFNNAGEVKKTLSPDKTFTLISGSFDLLHIGHIHVLEYASTLEELLVVAVLSDDYIRKYKSLNLPIINEKQRAAMLASLSCVDLVYISDNEPNSPDNLGLLKPNSVVYSKEVANAEKVKLWTNKMKSCSPDTKIKLLPRYDKEEVSTSNIIKKIRDIA